MDYIIRSITEADVPFLADLENKCFSNPWTENMLLSELEKERCDFFVLAESGEIKGYFGSYIILDECYIANVAVHPSSRRKGFGKALVRHAVNNAESNGCSFVSLEVRESNIPAINLYSSVGFEKAGLRKSFYSDPTEDGLIMTRYLSNENTCN